MANETILIVEDEPLVAMELKMGLEQLGYEVPEPIDSGEEALIALASTRPDLVIMDIRLNGKIDGIEVATRAKAERNLPIIFLTAYSDGATLKRASETGADGFLLKPLDENELSTNVGLALARAKGGNKQGRELQGAISLLDALEEPAFIADTGGKVLSANKPACALFKLSDPSKAANIDLSEVFDSGWKSHGRNPLKVATSFLESPMMVASLERLFGSDGGEYGILVIFGAMGRKERLVLEASAAKANSALENLLPGPSAAGPGFSVAGFLDPCLSGSGDFYDVFQTKRGDIAFYGLDVMGHGIIASLTAFSLHELIPSIGMGTREKVPSPAEVVRALYEHFDRREASGEKAKGEGERRREQSLGANFFTISYGLIDPSSGNYRVARAGHMPVLHLSRDGASRTHNTRGVAVGIASDAEIEEAEGVLAQGDRLLVASDGLVEAFGEGLLEKSLDKIGEFVFSHRENDLDGLVRAFREYYRQGAANRVVEDDASLLAIERLE